MRDDFCALILSHGRPDSVITLETLRKHGYSGKIYVVIDDEDKTADEYRANFGDQVLQFSKKEIAARFDEADNFDDRRAIFYARNASFDLAEQVGCRYFIQLDDDYKLFMYRRRKGWIIRNLDGVFEAMVDFLQNDQVSSIAMSQGGDHIGGFQYERGERLKRKAMNSFICDTQKRFPFLGRVNEDVNTYTTLSRSGHLFFTAMSVQLDQLPTQSNEGGMTDIYLSGGTYVKSFYSVVHCPSAVKIRDMGRKARRLHHMVDWNAAAPKIISEAHKKGPGRPGPVGRNGLD